MVIKTSQARRIRSYRRAARYHASVAVMGCACLYGCSIKDFSYLQKGSSTGGSSMGGDSNAGAGGASGGEVNEGGSGGVESTTTAKGGSGGTTTKTTTSTGGTIHGDCAYTSTGGQEQLLAPPSQGFEVEIGGWTTLGGQAIAVSRINGGTDACEGAWYLTVDGKIRKANWDGPALSLLPYLVAGHSYRVSIAIRLNPVGAPVDGQTVTMSVAKKCLGTAVEDTYTPLQAKVLKASWSRLTGNFDANMNGCTNVSSLDVYFDGGETGTTYSSIDVDDVKLFDVTVQGTGSGGTSGTGGTSG